MSRDKTGSGNSGPPGITTSETNKNPQRMYKDFKKDLKRVNRPSAEKFLKKDRSRRETDLRAIKPVKIDKDSLDNFLKKRVSIHAGHMYEPHAVKLSQYAVKKDLIIAMRDLNPATAERFQEGIKVDENVQQHLTTYFSPEPVKNSDEKIHLQPTTVKDSDEEQPVIIHLRPKIADSDEQQYVTIHLPTTTVNDSDEQQHLTTHFPQEVEKFTITNYSTGKDIDIKFKSSTILEGYIPIENKFAKLADKKADKKMQKMLNKPDSKYKAVTLSKQNSQGEIFTVCYYETEIVNENKTKQIFCYKKNIDGKDGKYYDALENGKEIDVGTKVIKPVLVLADKKTGKLIIPDYDLEGIGRRGNIGKVKIDQKLGVILDTDMQTLTDLQDITTNMIKHAFENLNPLGYTLKMTPETPYTIFTPDGKVSSCKTPQEYLDLLNQWRNPKNVKGIYNLIPNPKTGVTVNKKGELYLPEERYRFNWRIIDEEVEKIAAQAKEDHQNIRKRAKADMAILIAKSKEQYERQKMFKPSLNDQKLHQKEIRVLKKEIDALNKKYKTRFGEESPVQKAENSLPSWGKKIKGAFTKMIQTTKPPEGKTR